MPNYAYIEADLRCPYCNHAVYDVAQFQWGFCWGGGVIEEYVYHVGDKIRWKSCQAGKILDWTFFEDSKGYTFTCNIGEHHIKTLRIFNPYWLAITCTACEQRMAGVALSIENEIIERVWVCKEGEFVGDTEYYILENDAWVVKPEWNDHSMETVADC